MTFRDPKLIGLLALFLAVIVYATSGGFSTDTGPTESGFDGADPISLDAGVDPTPPLEFVDPIVPRDPFQGNTESGFSEAEGPSDSDTSDGDDDDFVG